MSSVIIYDGNCGFCNKTVRFFAKNDTNNCFKFVSNHSVFGTELLEEHKIKGMETYATILLEIFVILVHFRLFSFKNVILESNEK